MNTPKYDLKLFVNDPSNLALEAFIAVFHRWIQQHALADLLIDVADYRHVPYGPGVILIGHDAQYGIDSAVGGSPGLLYSRRRETHASRQRIGSARQRLQSVFRDTLTACRLLESEPTLQAHLQFRTDHLLLRVNDRLHAPNTDDGCATLQAHLEPFLQQLYPASTVKVEHLSDPKTPLTVRIKMVHAPSLDTLIERLDNIEMAIGMAL
jgi:hypothetical protein